MNRLMGRRTAIALMAGSVMASLPGCGVNNLVVRVPWAKVVSALVKFVKATGKWILLLVGMTVSGETEVREFDLESSQIEAVTVELKDGSKVTIRPKTEGK
jgi:hypothetical protein